MIKKYKIIRNAITTSFLIKMTWNLEYLCLVKFFFFWILTWYVKMFCQDASIDTLNFLLPIYERHWPVNAPKWCHWFFITVLGHLWIYKWSQIVESYFHNYFKLSHYISKNFLGHIWKHHDIIWGHLYFDNSTQIALLLPPPPTTPTLLLQNSHTTLPHFYSYIHTPHFHTPTLRLDNRITKGTIFQDFFW